MEAREAAEPAEPGEHEGSGGTGNIAAGGSEWAPKGVQGAKRHAPRMARIIGEWRSERVGIIGLKEGTSVEHLFDCMKSRELQCVVKL
jgi:hypothetical protein